MIYVAYALSFGLLVFMSKLLREAKTPRIYYTRFFLLLMLAALQSGIFSHLPYVKNIESVGMWGLLVIGDILVSLGCVALGYNMGKK